MTVCICGMHRSGTSMVSHVLSLCGIDLGPQESLTHSAFDNPDGFWEDAELVQLNDDILGIMFGGWDTPPVFSDDWETVPELASLYRRATQLIARRQEKSIWGWKDPRSSLTLPFWLNLIPDLQVIICLRHPLEVAQSLERRNTLSVPFGLQLWYAYQARLLASVQPGKWLITHYESHLTDPRAEILRITDFLNFAVAEANLEQAADVCKKSLQNNRVGKQSCLGMPRSVTKLYRQMCAHAGPVYDRILHDASGSSAAVAPWPLLPSRLQPLLTMPDHFTFDAATSLAADGRIPERAPAVPSPQDAEISRLRDDLRARDEEIERLHNELSRLAALDNFRENLQANAESLQRLSAELTADQTQIRALSGEISGQNAEIHRLTCQSAERENEIRRLSDELERREQRLAEVTREVESRTQEAMALRGDVAALSAETCQLGRELSSHREQAAGTAAGLAARDREISTLREQAAGTAADLAARDREISTLREEAAARGRLAENLRWQVSRLEQQLQVILGSRAWKAICAYRRGRALASSAPRMLRLAALVFVHFATFRFLRRNRPLAAPKLPLPGVAAAEDAGASPAASQPAAEATASGPARIDSPLFDAAWYQQQYPDVAGMDPLAHYLTYGAAEGRRPHPLFDSRWYLEKYPEVAQQGFNPLSHFLTFGAALGYWPNPLFDTAWYLRQTPEAARAGINPLVHFITQGAAEGRKPNPYFDPRWYLEQHPELAADVNPLLHYLSAGEAAGFQPSPQFDPLWYAAQNASVQSGGLGPLAHYLHVGRDRGAAPNPAAARVFAGSIPTLPLVFKRVESPLVSIIVPVHNQWHFTLWCLQSIWANSADVSYEVVLADDASTDETRDVAQVVQNITVIRTDPAHGGPAGFLANCNRAAAAARGQYLFFLNNDTLVDAHCLQALLKVVQQYPQAGMVGCKLLCADGRLQEAGAIVYQDASTRRYGRDDNPDLAEYNYLRETDYCSGAAILVRRDLWEQIGGFDERFTPAYCADMDLAFAVRQHGCRVIYQPQAVVIHFEGASHGNHLAQGLKRHQVAVNSRRFVDKWKSVLEQQHYLPGEPVFLARDHGRDAKRVLLFDWELPTPDCDSGSFRVCNLMRILKSLGYRVTLVPANLNAVPMRMAALQQEEIFTACGPGIVSIEQFLGEYGRYYQLAVVSRVNTAAVCMDIVRRHCPEAFLIFDTVDLHFLREERRAELEGSFTLRLVAAETKKKELGFVNRADLTLVVSPVEAKLLAAQAPGARVEIVSNIHPVHGCVRPFPERKDLLFIGGFRHTPNVDAVKWLVSDIFPHIRVRLPGVQLNIIGSDCPLDVQALSAGDVRVLGYVPDVEPYFHQCRLTVVPLRYGAGVKGKINMSMSYGVPVVSTSMGVEGMFLRDGEDVMVADTPAAFVDAVCQLYENPRLWQKLSQGGLENIRRHFSFEVAAATLRDILPQTPHPATAAAA